MRILAIDPGYDRMGMAVVEGDPSKPQIVWSTCVEPARGETQERLAEVFVAVADAISKYTPDILSIETLFFSNNRKTALGVAEARGTILAAAGIAHIPVREYSPQEVKLAVTGYGNAKKDAVMRMLPKLITLQKEIRRDDEYDAIAIGIAALSNHYPQTEK